MRNVYIRKQTIDPIVIYKYIATNNVATLNRPPYFRYAYRNLIYSTCSGFLQRAARHIPIFISFHKYWQTLLSAVTGEFASGLDRRHL